MAISKTMKREFGQRVYDLREQRELSQIQLGEQVGVSGTCVWNWEYGHTFPRSAALKKLARALNTSTEYLTLGQGSHSAESSGHIPSDQLLADAILKAQEMVATAATAAGVPFKEVRIMLDCGT